MINETWYKWDQLRAHGQFRHLDFQSLTATDRDTLIEWQKLATAMQAAHRYDLLLEGIGSLLRELSATLFSKGKKRRYALYSVRHEFAAVAKAVFTPCEVAALMGHAVDNTATTHYGRPRRSSQGVAIEAILDVQALPSPRLEEVVRVRATRDAKIRQMLHRCKKRERAHELDLRIDLALSRSHTFSPSNRLLKNAVTTEAAD